MRTWLGVGARGRGRGRARARARARARVRVRVRARVRVRVRVGAHDGGQQAGGVADAHDLSQVPARYGGEVGEIQAACAGDVREM